MSRAEALAADLEGSYMTFATFLESLSADQWRTRAANHPQIAAGEDERRLVGVIAHHVGETVPMFAERARRVATGEPLDPISLAEMDAANARHAAVHTNPDQAETVAMLRDNVERASEMIRELSDDDLDRPGARELSSWTAEQLIRRVLIGHATWHEGSIRATLEGSSEGVGAPQPAR